MKRKSCILNWWKETSHQRSAATAVILVQGSKKSEHISFQVLDEESDRLAKFLKKSFIPHECDRIGISISSLWSELVAVLAIIKCHAIYVPLYDLTRSTPERKKYIIQDADVLIVLSSEFEEEAAADIRNKPSAEYVLQGPDGVGESLYASFVQGPRRAVGEEAADLVDVFNILYTSGSTGLPKGVMGRESGYIHRIKWMHQAFPFGSQELTLRRTPLSFVDSVWELFGTLLGGTPLLIPATGGVEQDPLGFWDLAFSYPITRMTLTPSILGSLISIRSPEGFGGSLRYMICSGEALKLGLVRRFFSLAGGGTQLLHLYGSTEVAGDATALAFDSQSFDSFFLKQGGEEASRELLLLPLGEPLPGVKVYVKGGKQRKGELVVEGPIVALGYYGEKRRRFNGRFATGDIGFYERSRHGWQFEGRGDDLLKVRGVRLSLNEIERAVARALGGDGEAPLGWAVAPTAGKDGFVLALTGKLLAEKKFKFSHEQVLAFLGERLPSSLLPSKILLVEGSMLPTTASGKLDREALCTSIDSNETDLLKQQSVTQEEEEERMSSPPMLNAVKEWLRKAIARFVGDGGRSSTSMSNFFSRGGNSLLAVQFLSEIRQTWAVKLVVEDLGLDVPELAMLIHQRLKEERADPLRRSKRPRRCRAGEPVALQVVVQWRYDMGKCVDATPLIVAEKEWIVVGSHNHVVAALDFEGREIWRRFLPDRVEGSACLSRDGHLVMLGCYDFHLYALKVDTGEPVWSFATAGEVKCTPLSVAPGVVVFGSYDGYLYLLHETSGRKLCAPCDLGGSLFASPVPIDNKPKHGGAAASSTSSVSFVTVTNRGSVRLWSLNSSTNEPLTRWKYENGCAVFTTPVVSSSVLIYGDTDGYIRALNVEDGKLMWKTDLRAGPLFTSPSLCGDRAVLVGCHNGSLFRIDTVDGHAMWENKAEDGAITGQPLLGKIKEKSLVLVGTLKGQIRLIDADSGEYQELGLPVNNLGGERLGDPVFASRKLASIVLGSRDDGLYSIALKYDETNYFCDIVH